MFKAIVFDIGRTLIGYNKPLNWSSLYRPALEYIATTCGYYLTENDYSQGIEVLKKYNTRINPREYEISSFQLFTELTHALHLPMDDLEQVKHLFYSFFRQDSSEYSEVENTLALLHEMGILLGTLSDVAYGMDNEYVLDDISALLKYIPYPYTSNDTGYRKPSMEGLRFVARKMHIDIKDIIFVGDEEKDMICANNAGAYSVLINREGTPKEYGQKLEIHDLSELLTLFPEEKI